VAGLVIAQAVARDLLLLKQWLETDELLLRQRSKKNWLNLANVRVFVPSAASVSSILIGWLSRLETSLLFSTNYVREWFFRRHR